MTQTRKVETKRMAQKKTMVIGGTSGRVEKAEQPKETVPEPKPVKVPKKRAKKSKKNG